MPKDIDLQTVWKGKDLVIQKGVLKGKASVKGGALGSGIIYYPGEKKVYHLLGENRIVVATNQYQRYLCNPGRGSEITNQSSQPADFFRLQLNTDLSDAQVALAAGNLLHGRWPRQFRRSVLDDLHAIGELAKAAVSSKKPEAAMVRRATLAKEDLEFKLAWFNSSLRHRKRPLGQSKALYLAVHEIGFGGGGGGGRGSGGGGGGGGGQGIFNPKVQVTVDTVAPDGETEIKGYWVYALRLLDEESPGLADRFPKPSTPTKRYLDIGKYWMWIEKGGTVGKRFRTEIGDPDRPWDNEAQVTLGMA